ncbi:hypothetical protein BCR35DRAFT_311225 [Leucosporidium creatinivorum]|uniref:Polysaccharide lyase 14 domain-containing protein n=1 Tax=Leucosporidium creatinivorum TaxID=106004 RepID=A0A1Y2C8Q5_9BASI|nr:hypothetical protein BCR35DRAFT_311225 [Leucosporidium creatinivorum]
MRLPPGLIARDAATTTTLMLQKIATAAQLAGSFNLSRVWSATEATTTDLRTLDLSNSSNTANWLYNNWQLESQMKSSSYNTLAMAPDPFDAASTQLALSVNYPKGQKGGSQFWPLPWGNVSSNGTLSSGAAPRTAVLSYQVAFAEDWDFVKGGKLPGLYGGADTGQCTGGDRQLSCFSARLMWRTGGDGEVYAYSPQYAGLCEQTDVICGDNVYGISLSRGAFTFKKGAWTTVTELVALNTPPLANGLLYIYINDTLVLAQTGLVWRTDESVILSRVLFSTFFGGSSKSYYPPKDEQAYFKGFTIYSSDSPSNTTGPAVNATLYMPEGSTSSASSSSIASSWLLPLIIALLLHSFFASW